jgi:hypothetical protein
LDYHNLSILILSCDKFKPAWPVFYSLFNKYWPDFEGKIYHYSETEKVNQGQVISLNSNLPQNAASWSKGFLFALENIETDYVILMLEDFFLNKKVAHHKVVEYFKLMQNNPEVKCFRLMPIPPPENEINEEYGEFSMHQPYRISTQMAIWDKEYLKSIIQLEESPWEFEHNASERSKKMKGRLFGVLRKPYEERIATHVNGIIRGKLTQDACRFLTKEHIAIPKEIPINSWIEEYYWFSAGNFTKKILDYLNTNVFKFMWKHKL